VKVIWSPLAIERAHEEARFIAADKPEAALRWLDGLFGCTDRPERFPDSGRVVPEIGLPEFREVIFGKAHRVLYRRGKDRVSILTVRRSEQRLDVSEVVE
jgi:plasmid stabilization system protein ParE